MNNNQILYTGIGKRKTSVAKVFLQNGSGIIQVNNKPFETFFLGIGEERELIKNPLVLVNLNNVYDIDIPYSCYEICNSYYDFSRIDDVELSADSVSIYKHSEYLSDIREY
jgi:hypothetical protein